MKRVFCVVTLFFASCASIAGIPFPCSDFGWDLSEKKIIDETYLKLSGVLVGTTTFDEVVSIFGQSELYRPNNKNHSPELLCYKSESDDTTIILVLRKIV